jgi:hypothetical protein
MARRNVYLDRNLDLRLNYVVFLFCQLFRFVLENSYGLKRWEVGEIASKIGQLYYHY